MTAVALIAVVWIGWPLFTIASELRALRRLAERGRNR